MPGMFLSQYLALALSSAWMIFLSDILRFPSLTSFQLLLQCHFLRGALSGYQILNYEHMLPLLFILVTTSNIQMRLLFFILVINAFTQLEVKLFEGRHFCLLYSSPYIPLSPVFVTMLGT